MMRYAPHRSAGFLLTDVLFGLAIVSLLAATLAVAVHRSAASVQRVRAGAEAAAIAERLLNDVQLGRRPPSEPDGYDYRIERVDGGDREVGGGRWVRVTVTLDGRAATLIGVIPAHLQEVAQ